MNNITVHRFRAAVLVIALAPIVVDAQDESIRISNLPEIQAVTGSVTVAEPVPSNNFVRYLDTTVTTVPRRTTQRLIAGGVLETDGFTSVVLSLGGFVEGAPPEQATIGVILVPDEDFIIAALKEGVYLFPIEVTMTIPQESLPYVAALPKAHNLAFPRYRIYFFNTGPRTVKAQLYAFLRN